VTDEEKIELIKAYVSNLLEDTPEKSDVVAFIDANGNGDFTVADADDVYDKIVQVLLELVRIVNE
jgi:hypothetical protein